MPKKILILFICFFYILTQFAFAIDFIPLQLFLPSPVTSLYPLGQPAPFSMFQYPLYDNVGNRRAMTVTRPAAVRQFTYNYNNIYELTGVTGNQTHSYTYDLVGNRLNHNGTVYVPNNLKQYSLVGTQAYAYDLNGNLTNDGANTYTYDAENRLSAVSNQLAVTMVLTGGSVKPLTE